MLWCLGSQPEAVSQFLDLCHMEHHPEKVFALLFFFPLFTGLCFWLSARAQDAGADAQWASGACRQTLSSHRERSARSFQSSNGARTADFTCGRRRQMHTAYWATIIAATDASRSEHARHNFECGPVRSTPKHLVRASERNTFQWCRQRVHIATDGGDGPREAFWERKNSDQPPTHTFPLLWAQTTWFRHHQHRSQEGGVGLRNLLFRLGHSQGIISTSLQPNTQSGCHKRLFVYKLNTRWQ